jgi:hypothetical protein
MRRLGPCQHIAHRGRVPLPTASRLDPARIEGVGNLSQRRRSRFPNLTDDRQHIGSVVVCCGPMVSRAILRAWASLGPPSFTPRPFAAASAALVRAPIMANGFRSFNR